jgi:Bacterial Ig domain
LNGTATLADFEVAVRQVGFSTTSGQIGSQAQVIVSVFDGHQASPDAKAFISVVVGATPPELDLDANNSNGSGADYTATFTTGRPATPITDTDVLITDSSSTTIASASITLAINRQPDDLLTINGALPAGIVASSYDPATGKLTLTGSASLADYEIALHQVGYSDNTTPPFTGDRVFEITVNDGTQNSNFARTFMHVVQGVNAPPVLNLDANNSTTGGSDFLTTFTDGGAAVPIADTDTVITDSDSSTLVSATITLTNPHTDDVLTAGALLAGITASTYDPGTGTLALTGNATLADYEAALQQITFSNTGTAPTQDIRIIHVAVNDGTSPSNTATALVEVVEINNSPPHIDLDGDNSTALGTLYRNTFVENGAAVPVADTDNVITDPESPTLISATITLQPQAGDVLATAGALPAGITASAYDPATGVLVLSGTATLAAYQTAVAQVTFASSGDNPVAGERLIETVLDDGINLGNSAVSIVNVVAVNDPPALSLAANATFQENGAPIALSPSINLTDPDNTTLGFASVAATDGSFAGDGDVLTVNGATSGTLNGVTFLWDATAHTLEFSGAASVTDYQSLLQQVEFQSIGDNPTNFGANVTRTLEWTAFDGQNATSVNMTINVIDSNDPPVITVAPTAAYTENDPPTTISPAATITDPDSFDLTAGQVTIIDEQPGDLLTVNGQQSGTFAGIDFSFQAGTLDLAFDRSAPVADYEAFLQAIQFSSTSSNPTNFGANPTRTILWAVTDGDAVSITETTTLNINPVDDAPVAQDGSASGNEDTPINGTLVATDVDSTALTYSLAAQAANGVVVVNPDGTFTYTPNANFNGADSFTFLAHDGQLDSNIATEHVTINPVDDAPVAQDGSASGNEDTPINGTLVATDVDSTALTYSLGAQAANGVVVVTPDGTFTYTPNANFNGADSFTFLAHDGQLDSNIATEHVTLNPVNDAPSGTSTVITTTEDIAHVFSVAEVGFTDPDSNNLLAVEITTTPDIGALTDNGAAVAPGAFVSAADIASGLLVYTPPINTTGSPLTSFAFQVQDNGGTANGGIDLDPSAKTMTIDVARADDPPVNTVSGLQSGIEDTPMPIGGVSVTDPDGDPVTTTLAIGAGTLHVAIGGATITGNGSGAVTIVGTIGDVNAALAGLILTPAVDFNGTATLTMTTSDGTLSDTDTIPVSIAAVDDAPVITSDGGGQIATVGVPENTTAVTTVHATDVDSSVLSYAITGGADSFAFQIDATTGMLSFITAPDFERPMDSDHNNSYLVEVSASDGTLHAAQDFTVNVTDVAEGTGNLKLDTMLAALAAAGIHTYDQYYLT